MRPDRSRHNRRQQCLALLLCALLLVGCGWQAARPTAPTPGSSATARRATPSATPLVRDPRARDGAALIVQALTLLQTATAEPRGSAELYGTAYAGTVNALRRRGGTPTDTTLPLTNDPPLDASLFTTAYLFLAGALPPGSDQTGLAYAAIRAVTNRLDECNTYLLSPAEEQQRQRIAEQQASGYGGIGINLRADAAGAMIALVYPNTPAAHLGLRPGDRIVAIDGATTAGLPAEQVGALLRGPPGTAVTLSIARTGAAGTRLVTLAREGVQPPTLTSRIIADTTGRRVGVVRIPAVTAATAEALNRTLADFVADGVATWILDLRESTGGAPADLLALALPLLGGGATVAYQVRNGEIMALTTPAGRAGTTNPPGAVLIGGGTTGMAEILTAALRDTIGVREIGEATAGCVSLSMTQALADGATLHLGVAQLRSPAGRTLTRVGEIPRELVWGDPTGATDPPLLAALR